MNTDLGNTTQSNLTGVVEDFELTTTDTDHPTGQQDTEYMNNDFTEQVAYVKECPELRQVMNAKAFWTAGKGYEASTTDKVILEKIRGTGKENILGILMNMLRTKMGMREAYAHIIRSDSGTLINLKVLNTGVMKQIYGPDGMLKEFRQMNLTNTGVEKVYKPSDIFLLTNDRMIDSMGGTSITENVKWYLDAKREAEKDWRRLEHVSSIRVMYVDMDDTARLNKIKQQYAEGIQNKEVMIVTGKKGEVEFENLVAPPIDVFLRWIEHLENVFYQQTGVPRVIATSENYTDAGAKTGFLTFEPVYTTEQKLLEAEIWNQLAIRIKFNRPPSLSNDLKKTEQKAGPIGFQPSDAEAGAGA